MPICFYGDLVILPQSFDGVGIDTYVFRAAGEDISGTQCTDDDWSILATPDYWQACNDNYGGFKVVDSSTSAEIDVQQYKLEVIGPDGVTLFTSYANKGQLDWNGIPSGTGNQPASSNPDCFEYLTGPTAWTQHGMKNIHTFVECGVGREFINNGLYEVKLDICTNSGCYQLTLACESGTQRVLDDIIDKRLPLETVYPAIENAKKAGMQVHTYWILGFPGETYEEVQKTVDFAMKSGADSYSFSCLQPLPGTRMYRQAMKENLWWPGRSLETMTFRSSLVKVDGFDTPQQFEKFVDEANIKANLLFKEKDPEAFKHKYGANVDHSALIHQT